MTFASAAAQDVSDIPPFADRDDGFATEVGNYDEDQVASAWDDPESQVWIFVREPTEVFANATEVYGTSRHRWWNRTDDVLWVANPHAWFLVRLLIIDGFEGNWGAAVSEDWPSGYAIWLALDRRVDVVVGELAPPVEDLPTKRLCCVN